MGLDLSPLVTRQVTSLRALRGKSFAVDANNTIYQFLALIRQPDGRPFTDAQGRVTSHLMGLMFRTTRLLWEHDMRFIFVFDGAPPKLKEAELEKRRELKRKAEEAYRKALEAGDLAAAWSKAVVTSRLTTEIKEDALKLLDLLGIPRFEAPSEAEAQAAYLARKGEVWAVHSRDYDTLLFGAPRLVRHLTFTGREFLPKSRESRPLEPEVMELQALEANTGLTREQLVDAAILMGTDFNEGIYGIGPKKAVGFMRKYGKIEALPEALRSALPANYGEIRAFFLDPPVVDSYPTEQRPIDEAGLHTFLCDERGFSPERVSIVVERMKRVAERRPTTLDRWSSEGS
jgi:flap endonuclease-1